MSNDDDDRDSQDEADSSPEEKVEEKVEAKKAASKEPAKEAVSKEAVSKEAAPKKEEKVEAKPAEKKKAAARQASSERPAERPAGDKKVAEKKAAAAHAVAHGHHKPDRRQYVVIWAWLGGLTVLEVGVAYMQSVLGKVALVTALVGLALAKAGCVALFYMHLKHETKVMRWTVAFPLLFPALYAFILIAEGIYRSVWGGGA
jgi:caa(3)-type oxidase subunit IV